MERSIQTRWWIGDVVYRRVDSEAAACLIIGLNINPGGHTYRLALSDGTEAWHYEMELDSQPNYILENVDEEDEGGG